jgi:20S proteasome subunit beta 2
MVTRVDLPKSGFCFENYQRNVFLEQKGAIPKSTKTGTTIVAIKFKDGVILGADTRATGGSIILDKECNKIHYIAPNIYGCGAGTAADTDFTAQLTSSQLELHRLATGRESRVVTALSMIRQHLFRHQGHIAAALILGGVDCTGSHLFNITPHGCSDKLPFMTNGSGSLASLAILETRWRKDMERDEALELVKDAVKAGIFNDLGSGSSIDVCIIEKGRAEKIRSIEKPNPTPPKEASYKFARGTTGIIKESIRDLATVTEIEAMDIS